MDVRSVLVLSILFFAQVHNAYRNRRNSQHDICNLSKATFTSNSSKDCKETNIISFTNVDVPESSSDLFQQLLDKAKNLYLYHCEIRRINLPIGLLKLSIIYPVKPIEIGVTPNQSNESYTLKTFGIAGFDKLPTQITYLESLEHFSCKATHILELDFELFARMENLTTISMVETYTNDILVLEAWRFPLLRKLTIWGNHLTTLNATSWNFPSLEELNLGYNNFTVLPQQIVSFGNLTFLNIRGNQLKSIDMHTFAPLRHLAVLDLQNNHLSSITGQLQLPRLSQLRLNSNRLVELDVSQWYLPALHRVSLGHNLLKSVIGFMECFGGASFIHMNENPLDCSWLQEIGHLIRGMVISYYHRNSSMHYCQGNRLGKTERSFIAVNVNETIQLHPL